MLIGERSRPIEGVRNPDSRDEKPRHAREQQQRVRGSARWHAVGQPRIATVHPPEDAEEQEDAAGSGEREVALQRARELGKREDEDDVEEGLDRGDAVGLGRIRVAPMDAGHGDTMIRSGTSSGGAGGILASVGVHSIHLPRGER
jgi:hypothetical protein